MPLNDFDAIVIVDADTVVDPGFADALALRAPLHGKAVQALYGTSNPFDSWLTRLASLFEDVRYRGQFPLKRSTGLNVPLTGNGMLLGRDLLTRHGWATDSLTEDLELYARYTAAGEEVDFAPGAILYAQEARDLHQSRVQRRRWQAGRWQVLGRNALPLLCSSRIGVHQKVDALSELVFPGPVTHAAVALTAGFLSLHSNILVRLVGALFAVSAVPTVGWTVWALARRPDRLSLVVDLLWLPFYAAWRLWTAVTALARAHGKSWERSPRHRP
jgi:cellulose synthase/poly-beta-1,6-N-acetylglucosamine synthase-like glycosyltransferase